MVMERRKGDSWEWREGKEIVGKGDRWQWREVGGEIIENGEKGRRLLRMERRKRDSWGWEWREGGKVVGNGEKEKR